MSTYAEADDLVLFGRRPSATTKPKPRRKPRDGRKVYLRTLCPGGVSHNAPLVASSDGHLVIREHDISTIGGGRVPCGAAGRTVHDPTPPLTDRGGQVQCICEGRPR